MKKNIKFYVWIAVLAALVGIGAYAWNIQYTQGLAVTGMGDIVFWGIYIASFVFLLGASVGVMVVINIGYISNEEKFRPLMKMGGLLAIASILPAMFLIVVDIGRPDRIFNVILYGDPTSMFVWDFILVTISLALRIIFTLIFSIERGGKRIAAFFATSEIVLATIEHSVTAWVFGVVIARPLWNTALLAPIFLSSALISGIALLAFVAVLASKFGALKIPSELFSVLKKALVVAIPVDLFFIFAEVVTATYNTTPDLLSVFSNALAGPYATVILIEIALFFAVFVPLVYSKTRNSLTVLSIVSLIAMAGIWAKRFFVSTPSLSISPLGETATYSPTLVEWQITIGLFALGALLFSIGLKVLPRLEHGNLFTIFKTKAHKLSLAEAYEEEQGMKESPTSNMSRRTFLTLTTGATVGAAVIASVPRSSISLAKGELDEQPSPIKEWAMVVDLRRCIGCQACFAACKSENGVPLGIQYTWVETHEEGKYPNTKLTFLPRICNHCDNPPCVPVCPVNATFKREQDGIVMQDVNRCIGCRYCIAACPYEVRSFLWNEPSGAWPETWRIVGGGKAQAKQGFVVKCHGCFHRIEQGLKPACVEACVGGARIFGDLQDPNSEVNKIIDTVPTQRLKSYLGTKPMTFYVGLSDTLAERGKKAPDSIFVHKEE